MAILSCRIVRVERNKSVVAAHAKTTPKLKLRVLAFERHPILE
jgi:hypothetical protein